MNAPRNAADKRERHCAPGDSRRGRRATFDCHDCHDKHGALALGIGNVWKYVISIFNR